MPKVLKEKEVKFTNIGMTRTRRLFGPLLPAIKLKILNLDILHIHHIPLYEKIRGAIYLAKVPRVIVTEHAKYSISKSQKLQKACRNAESKIDKFTTVSNNLKEFFIGIGLPQNSIKVIYNGVDIQKFKPNKKSKIILSEKRSSENIILSVGRLTEAKDHKNLLNSCKILYKNNLNYKCLLVGDGELKHELENMTLELGLNDKVFFLGNRTDVSNILNNASVFVLHSQREGLPVALLEAMASGLPVVATNVGGVPEIIKNGTNGIIIEPNHPEGLADAIQKIFSDKKFAISLGENARKTINNFFSLDSTAKKYSELYMCTYRNNRRCKN